MSDSGIKLSPRHGVNPSLGICYYCNKENGEVILPGRLKGDVEAPRAAVWHKQPCEECAGWMAKGIILISVRDDADPSDENPYRTGGWSVVTEEAIRRMLDSGLAERLCSCRYAFVPDEAWEALGLGSRAET